MGGGGGGWGGWGGGVQARLTGKSSDVFFFVFVCVSPQLILQREPSDGLFQIGLCSIKCINALKIYFLK